ncbi:translation initiation factor IF-2-like [Strigops habroptila]|uniref:translation initiation factor IF-2-like n=1 Tax=Strigops habroptila TaxID=2489341 RepID=UPI0011CFE573|nr:translation initiation factor IF-2-like [Strigops habroptila]
MIGQLPSPPDTRAARCRQDIPVRGRGPVLQTALNRAPEQQWGAPATEHRSQPATDRSPARRSAGSPRGRQPEAAGREAAGEAKRGRCGRAPHRPPNRYLSALRSSQATQGCRGARPVASGASRTPRRGSPGWQHPSPAPAGGGAGRYGGELEATIPREGAPPVAGQAGRRGWALPQRMKLPSPRGSAALPVPPSAFLLSPS